LLNLSPRLLVAKKKSTEPHREQIRRTHVKKTHRILFSKYRKYEWKHAKEVASSSGVQVEEHKLEELTKLRSCKF